MIRVLIGKIAGFSFFLCLALKITALFLSHLAVYRVLETGVQFFLIHIVRKPRHPTLYYYSINNQQILVVPLSSLAQNFDGPFFKKEESFSEFPTLFQLI